MLLADGTPTADAFLFASRWRIRTAAQSLFTYNPAKGPRPSTG